MVRIVFLKLNSSCDKMSLGSSAPVSPRLPSESPDDGLCVGEPGDLVFKLELDFESEGETSRDKRHKSGLS